MQVVESQEWEAFPCLPGAWIQAFAFCHNFALMYLLLHMQALVLLRNRNQLTPNEVLPLFFRMFRCQDKQLRQMLFKHIVSGAGIPADGLRAACANRACH